MSIAITMTGGNYFRTESTNTDTDKLENPSRDIITSYK